MHPVVAGLIGASLTLAVFLLVLIVRRGIVDGRRGGEVLALDTQDLVRIVESQPWPAVLVGEHDEILAANRSIQAHALVQGTRLADRKLLGLVRTVRREGHPVTGDLVEELRGSVTPLPGGLVMVVADDVAEARRVDEVRRDFLAGASHELKTPIGAIAILSEAIGEAVEDAEAVAHFTGRLNRESTRLSGLVEQIIELSRVQSAPVSDRRLLEIRDVVDEAIGHCLVLAESRAVQLVQGPVTAESVLGDGQQLVVALTNLVKNAVTHSAPGSRVVVHAFVAAELSVVDSGPGIPPAEQERIFERFYRTDFARSRNDGGSGLGLAIVRHSAESHGGEVSVWSVPGQGSTFTLSIPSSQVEGREDP